MTEQNAAAVVDICHRLDGIPLAIELAAARVRALSVADDCRARLSDRFRLLVTGDQTVLPRQRTLRALIDWSYDLLTEAERTLFQRLSVFAGGWTLEAAEAVCADDDLPKDDVLELLTSPGRKVAGGDGDRAASDIECWTRFGTTRKRNWLNRAMEMAVHSTDISTSIWHLRKKRGPSSAVPHTKLRLHASMSNRRTCFQRIAWIDSATSDADAGLALGWTR